MANIGVTLRDYMEWIKDFLEGLNSLYWTKGSDTNKRMDQEMILYCGGGYRSALAADNLTKMGYTKAVSMDGGFRGWKEAGNPIVKDS
ncbi:MAG: hypothetical protein IH899_13865 [Planctomycetes bacterium]|nr:hypothetical protein [Planctomycetota bacterium]